METAKKTARKKSGKPRIGPAYNIKSSYIEFCYPW